MIPRLSHCSFDAMSWDASLPARRPIRFEEHSFKSARLALLASEGRRLGVLIELVPCKFLGHNSPQPPKECYVSLCDRF